MVNKHLLRSNGLRSSSAPTGPLSIVALVAAATLSAIGCDSKGSVSSSATATAASSATAPEEDVDARKVLEPALSAIGSYRYFIQPDLASERFVVPYVAVIAAQEVAGVVVPPGSTALSKAVAQAIESLKAACKADVNGKATELERWWLARTRCSDAIDALQATIDGLVTTHPAAARLPKVPAISTENASKTALGKVFLTGNALRAYREAHADKSSTQEALEEKCSAAQAEQAQLASDFAKDSARGSPSSEVAEAAVLIMKAECLNLSADVGRRMLLVACERDLKKCEERKTEICARAKKREVHLVAARWSDYPDLRRRICGD